MVQHCEMAHSFWCRSFVMMMMCSSGRLGSRGIFDESELRLGVSRYYLPTTSYLYPRIPKQRIADRRRRDPFF